MDEEGDQFVAYFLPTPETRGKRKRDVEEGLDYDPELTYDYRWGVNTNVLQTQHFVATLVPIQTQIFCMFQTEDIDRKS